VGCIDKDAGHNLNPAQRQRGLISQNCPVVFNPWRFSFINTPVYDKIRQMPPGQPVVIYYDNPVFSLKNLMLPRRVTFFIAFIRLTSATLSNTSRSIPLGCRRLCT
jgi:hypothetical protein